MSAQLRILGKFDSVLEKPLPQEKREKPRPKEEACWGATIFLLEGGGFRGYKGSLNALAMEPHTRGTPLSVGTGQGKRAEQTTERSSGSGGAETERSQPDNSSTSTARDKGDGTREKERSTQGSGHLEVEAQTQREAIQRIPPARQQGTKETAPRRESV